MLRKTIRFADKTVDRVVAVLCLLLFLICLYAMYDAYMVYMNATDKGVLKYKPELGKAPEVLAELSEDAVAWLSIDDTAIDYPIMQGKTNDEYLNKDPFGNFSLSGSIFLDNRNDKNFEDDYSLVYGHHMEYGAMFGALDSFSKPDYFDAHRTGTLMVVNGKSYQIEIFACSKTQATEKTVFDPPETSAADLPEYLTKNALIYKPGRAAAGERIIALSTCQSAETIERMVVFGVLKEIA